MSNAELDNLIDAFLAGELDDAGRQRLAVLLESDQDARRAFDDALQMESLLLTAHVDEKAEALAVEQLRTLLKRANPATDQAQLPDQTERPASINKPLTLVNRSQRPNRLPSRTLISAWTALAASIVILFGLAFYFIYDPGTGGTTDKTAAKKSDGKKIAYSVVSGRVLIDGKDATEIAEDEWLNVPASGPASLRATDGANVTLDPGTRALLRKRGATLMNGAGRFGVKSGADAFLLQTPLGTVNSAMGEFEARLESANAASAKQPSLSVTVASGSAQVEYKGKLSKLDAGESRVFCDVKANGNEGRGPDPSGPRIRPPEQYTLDIIMEHAKELGLTAEQQAQLSNMEQKMNEANAKLKNDEKMKQLMDKQHSAEATHDRESMDSIRDEIKTRKDQVLGPRPFGNPMDFLNESQRRTMEPFLQDRPKGPLGNGGEPPHPPPPPRPLFPLFPPPPGKEGKPPPF